MQLRWTPAAATDLQQIFDYIFERNPEKAPQIARQICEAAALLKHSPRIGRPGRKEKTRELVVTGSPYLVVYEIADTTIQIVRILHGARRWPE
jgi:addiction module RelE/StbE family toxin